MSEIDTYQAGRELDQIIAKEVFDLNPEWSSGGDWGYWRTVGKLKTDGYERSEWYRLPRYSTDNGDALKVVEYLCQDDRKPHDLYFKLVYAWWYKADRESKGYPLVRAVFDWKETGDSKPLYQGLAGTIPLAICRAALRAVREDVTLPEVKDEVQP